jgi:hypothetical protein
MTYRCEAKESVGYQATWTIGQAGAPVDLSGWVFALELHRQAGAPDLTLGMAGSLSPSVQGFFVFDGAKGQLAVNILPASLQAIVDTTGNFTLFGDLLGTPPGSAQQFVKAIQMRVKV